MARLQKKKKRKEKKKTVRSGGGYLACLGVRQNSLEGVPMVLMKVRSIFMLWHKADKPSRMHRNHSRHLLTLKKEKENLHLTIVCFYECTELLYCLDYHILKHVDTLIFYQLFQSNFNNYHNEPTISLRK